MSPKFLRLVAVVCLALFALAVPAMAQDAPEELIAALQGAQQVVIEVPAQGIGYTEEGELVLIAFLTNVGEETSSSMDITAVLLNDCILPSVLQTCRFAAFGVFDSVTPDGIAPGETVQWTFNFGPYPQLDLSRWSVIWYQVAK